MERRSEPRHLLPVVADMIAGTREDRVICGDLSMSGCTLRLNYPLNPKTHVILRIYGDQGKEGFLETFEAIPSTVRWYRQSKSDPRVYYAGLKFNHPVRADQGVPRLLYPELFQKATAEFLPRNRSLRGTLVQCRLCGHRDLCFLMLKARSMQTQSNLFGIPIYIKATEGHDFCDFSLLQVTVCPECYFASNDINFFRKQNEEEGTPSPFSIGLMYRAWKDSIPQRRMLLEAHQNGFYGEERTPAQALLAYTLGIQTCEQLYQAEPSMDYPRKAISFLMYQAELLMNQGQREAAQEKLRQAAQRGEEIFNLLRGDAVIRVGLLLGLIKLYFKDYSGANQYLTFMRLYEREGRTLEPSEAKVLKSATERLDEALLNRERYAYDQLTSFSVPPKE